MNIFRALAICAILAGCGSGSGDVSDRPGLNAEKLGTVSGPGACGVPDAVRLTSAAGVRLSQPATLTGTAALRLDNWLRNHAVPVIGNKGGGLVQIRVASHYACRTRNSRPGARLSEHARGRAIDISAFILADGTRITILDDWNGGNGRLLRQLHSSACGPFGTVLGPNSDAHHRDHFHFDIADYRSGSYCR